MPCMHRMPLGPVGLNGMAIYACQGKVLRGCTCVHVSNMYTCTLCCMCFCMLCVFVFGRVHPRNEEYVYALHNEIPLIK